MRKFFASIFSPVKKTTGISRWMLLTGVLITAMFLAFALFAPWLSRYGFDQHSANGQDFPKLGHPSSAHWFGTNDLSLDVYSHVVWGSRTALEVVLLSVIASVLIGVPLGLMSGYFSGWLDRVLVLFMDAIFAFPSFLLAVVLAFLFTDIIGGGVVAAALSLTAIYVPQYFRVVRNSTISAREATYIEAARAIGAPDRVIMRRYLFGNVIQSVPVIGTLNAADAIGVLAGLGFLGLGIQPDVAAEWGFDLQRALDDAQAGIWWTALFPGLAIVLLITGLTLVGEGLNETVNPTLRRRRLLPVVMPPRESKQTGTTTTTATTTSAASTTQTRDTTVSRDNGPEPTTGTKEATS